MTYTHFIKNEFENNYINIYNIYPDELKMKIVVKPFVSIA